MKAMNIYFEDEEYEFLVEEREKMRSNSWKEFILTIAGYEKKSGTHESKRL